MKTKALRLYGKDDLRLEEFELGKINDDEVLAEIVTDSICMSSYKAAKQGDGFVLDVPFVIPTLRVLREHLLYLFCVVGSDQLERHRVRIRRREKVVHFGEFISDGNQGGKLKTVRKQRAFSLVCGILHLFPLVINHHLYEYR